MNGNTFSKILLVQAIEETDPFGRHLPLSTRHHATRQARDMHQLSSDYSEDSALSFLITRSDTLWAFVEMAFPTFAKSWKHREFDIPSTLIGLTAFLAGLLINGLGDSQRVNLLNFPLLILLLWNVGIYLSTAWGVVHSNHKPQWLDSTAQWLAQVLQRRKEFSPGVGAQSEALTALNWMQETTTRLTELWWPQGGQIWTYRLRHLLHIGAACVALGMIIGMYFRGLALDYQATWESTFLSVDQVHAILNGLLGPAAWLLQYPFPRISEIANLQAPAHGPAAQWIHMWAVTITAVIVVPRSIMGWQTHRSLIELKENFSLDLGHPYFVHLLAPDRGQGVQIDVLPYSHLPSPTAKNFLDLALMNMFGHLATIHWYQPIPFGQEYVKLDVPSPHIRTCVVIFNASQTPEVEVHGEWLHSLQTHMSPTDPKGKLLILLDEEPYSQTMDENRMTERRQAWQQQLSQYHLSIVPFQAQTSSTDQFLQQAKDGLWPTPA